MEWCLTKGAPRCSKVDFLMMMVMMIVVTVMMITIKMVMLMMMMHGVVSHQGGA